MNVGVLHYFHDCNNNVIFKNPNVYGLGENLSYHYVYLYEKAKSEGSKNISLKTFYTDVSINIRRVLKR